MKINNCAMIITSCDTYEDLWNPFFKCIEHEYKDEEFPFKLYLNTEHKKYNNITNLDITTINQKQNHSISWSKRMIEVLKNISEEYVFIVVDDFFLKEKINLDLFLEALTMMKDNKKIIECQFKREYIYCGQTDLNNNFAKLGLKSWKVNFVPSVWKKKELLKWLRPWETIWGFEGYGSRRARYRYKNDIIIECKKLCYNYLWINGCSPVLNGKWMDYNNEVEKFFNSRNIRVNFNSREKINKQQFKEVNLKKINIIKRYKLHELPKKIICYFLSYF